MDGKFFFQGETLEQFSAGFGANLNRFTQMMAEARASIAGIDLPQDLQPVRYVMVIAEPWSGDVLYFLPPAAALAEKAGWEMRIFHRDQHPDLIEPYRKDGLYLSIPVFVFCDEAFNELAHWVERPQEATRVIDEEMLALRRRLREDHKESWRNETVREMIHLFKAPE